MSPSMTLEECHRKLDQLREMQRIVSYGPDKTRLAEQVEALRRLCAELEGKEAARH